METDKFIQLKSLPQDLSIGGLVLIMNKMEEIFKESVEKVKKDP